MIRIKVLQSPLLDELDGIDLRHFVPGQIYDVGNRVGALLLTERWAEPVGDLEPPHLVLFSENDPFLPRVVDGDPPNRTREVYPPYADDMPLAADLERRKRPRRPSE